MELRRPAATRLATVLWCLLAVVTTSAEELTGFVEVVGGDAESRSEDAAQSDRDAETRSVVRRLSFTWNKPLFPTLRLLVGGVFERNDAESAVSLDSAPPVDSDTEASLVAPFVDLVIDTPLFSMDVNFNHNEEKTAPSTAPALTLVRRRYASRFGWRPVDLPSVELRVSRSESFDRQGLIRDNTDDLYQLDSEYYPVDDLRLRYTLGYRDLQDDFEEVRLQSWNHSARITYAGRFWQDRISLNSDYTLTYRDIETTASGQGEVLLPLFPIGGLASIDDTPLIDPLGPNPALIDEDRVVPAGIDIGLPPPAGDARPRNIGLDFGSDVEINTLQVWVDRDLDPLVADSFTWAIYTSNDNQDWSLHEVVGPAVFGPTQTRFDVRFSAVTARYVKLVVDPLAPSVPGAQSFPDIFVTELDARIRKPAADVATSAGGTTHLYSLDSRVRVLENHPLYYELTAFVSEASGRPTTLTISNGLSYSHSFNEIYSTFARISREDGEERNRNRTAHNLTASLSATPLETLRHTLVFSSRDVDLDLEDSDDTSVFLFSVAELYRGVDLNVGIGRAFRDGALGKAETTRYSVSSTLTPHRSTTVNLLYQENRDEFTSGRRRGTVDLTRTEEISLAFRPLATVYMYGSHRIEDRPDFDQRTVDNYAASWSPFPDGTLHFTFSYNETSRSELDTTERIVTPSLRWDITRRSYLDLAYQMLDRNSATQHTETEIYSGTLRVGF